MILGISRKCDFSIPESWKRRPRPQAKYTRTSSWLKCEWQGIIKIPCLFIHFLHHWWKPPSRSGYESTRVWKSYFDGEICFSQCLKIMRLTFYSEMKLDFFFVSSKNNSIYFFSFRNSAFFSTKCVVTDHKENVPISEAVEVDHDGWSLSIIWWRRSFVLPEIRKNAI